MIANMRNLRPSAELRQVFQYKNMHYVVLTELFPVLLNTSFTNYVDEHIFEPLGMKATYANGGEGRTEGWLRTGLDRTKCAEIHRGVKDVGKGEIDEVCLGQPRSFGRWLEGDAEFNAGPRVVTMSGSDMVRQAFVPSKPSHSAISLDTQ